MDLTNANLATCSAIADELSRLGVRLAVISPGSRSTPLAVAFDRQQDIETFVGIDERACSYLALGAAQATRTPVVLICTSGTAAANYLPAITEADLSAVPLLVLTADRPPELRGIGAGQAIDQIKIYGDAVRLFIEVGNHPADDEGLIHARSLACRAFAAAAGDPRPGPVHLNFGLREPLAPVAGSDPVEASAKLALEGRSALPLTEVITAVPRAGKTELARIRDLLDGRTRFMVVAGRHLDPSIRGPVMALASHLGAPVLAEPTSQLRSGAREGDPIVWRYQAVLSDGPILDALLPDAVIRIGDMPTSKALRGMLSSAADCVQIVIDPEYGWNEPSRIASMILRMDVAATLDDLAASLPASENDSFTEAWLSAQRATLEGVDEAAVFNRAAIHRAVRETSRDGDIVYTASSLAVRDQEATSFPDPREVTFLANRGANGIDGLISSGIGAALASGRRTTIITGDVGFRHDAGALDLLAGLDLDVRILVVNDGGGRIFESLPQKGAMSPDEFERLMLAAGEVEAATLAATWGIPATRVDDGDALTEALEHPGPLVIEAFPVA